MIALGRLAPLVAIATTILGCGGTPTGICEVAESLACTTGSDCRRDERCDTTTGQCVAWSSGGSDVDCVRDPLPGVFFPRLQCEWASAPPGDRFPAHTNVLATPAVATFYGDGELASPSIVFTAYNFTDGGGDSCRGDDPAHFGVIRIVDGRTCEQQATLSEVPLLGSASVAIAELAGGAPPEIVAPRNDGGLVAFTLRATKWEVLWQTTSRFGDDLCNWGGPSIHDLDDDGKPEVIYFGAVFDGATGATIDESVGGAVDALRTGYIPVVADLDGDHSPDLVSGTEIYSWNRTSRKWDAKQTLPFANGHVAVADFGTFPSTGPDLRESLDGVAEVVVVYMGVAKVFNVFGRELSTADLILTPPDTLKRGGPPTIADFDGDGRVEFAAIGGSMYHVLDLDCRGLPDPSTCPSGRTDGIAWAQPAQDISSNKTGSSVFDFDGDGRAEVVYGDECFTRVYDGVTGDVLFSHQRSSCTFYENPIVVDVDADLNAEIISTSNTNCDFSCPTVDPTFDGLRCVDDSSCPSTSRCGRNALGDPFGRCRCVVDADCGGDGYVCLDPIAGPSTEGKVCRASHPPTTAQAGIQVLADVSDRWVNTRTIWNQHAYSVTNIGDDGLVPRTSAWFPNWTLDGLNSYRQNTPGQGRSTSAVADLTIRNATAACASGEARVIAEICNRGTEAVVAGLPVSVYSSSSPAELHCTMQTADRLEPGSCEELACTYAGAFTGGVIVVDDRGDGIGVASECREDNNTFTVCSTCP